jgi:hypothetical protein
MASALMLARWCLCAISVALLSTAAGAQPTADVGPAVGERVPAFSLQDQTGRVRTLESIMGSNGAVIVFYRSADW